MAKEQTAAAQAGDTKVEQTENDALFGHVTDQEKAAAGFTDEELAAMSGDDEEGGEPEGEADEGEEAEAGEGEQAEGTEGEEAEGEEGEEAAEGESTEGEEAGDEAGEGAEEGEEEPEPINEDDPAIAALLDTRSVLAREWALPKEARESLAAMQQAQIDLATKFDEGDLTAKDYNAQNAELTSKVADLRMDIRSAERAFSTAQAHWEGKTVDRFLRDHPEWKRNPTMLNTLDAEVRRLQNQGADPFDPRILINADRNLKRAMGIAVPTDRQQQPAAKDAGKGKGNPIPPGKKAAIPPTLARVPNDEINDVEGGRYARLDRLATKDPTAYEEAMEKMSEAERDAYLAS